MEIRLLLNNMLSVTEEKVHILNKIARLTIQQSEAIAAKQLTDFLSLCSEKQQWIEKVNKLDEMFHEAYENVRSQATGRNFKEVIANHIELDVLQQSIAEVQKLTEEITRAEAKNKVEYKEMFSEMMGELKTSIASRQNKIAEYMKMSKPKENR